MIDIGFAVPTALRLADALEFQLVFGREEEISTASLSDETEEEGIVVDVLEYDGETDLVDDDGGAVDRTARELSPAAMLAEDAMAELQARSEQVGPSYPIEVIGRRARRRVDSWQDCLPYSLFLTLNARVVYGLKFDWHLPARLFERTVVPALRAYWGGEAEHFGWPRDAGEEAAFPPAFRALIGRMRERMTREDEDLHGRLNDLEVDAVAWRPLDKRRGHTIMLCQCAIGTDWDSKGVHIELWGSLVDFAVMPSRALAYPFVGEALREFRTIDWDLLCAKVGVPFDRIRLASLLDGVPLDAQLSHDVESWVGSVVGELPV